MVFASFELFSLGKAGFMKAWAMILAAGRGRRLADFLGEAKQFYRYQNVPLFWHSVRTFARCPLIGGIVVVLPRDMPQSQELLLTLKEDEDLGIPIESTFGGELRQDSVRLGLSHIPSSHVLVHDAARPFVTNSLVVRVLEALSSGKKAVIPVLPVTDTIKMCEKDRVLQTLPRERLFSVQTPQGFETSLLKEGHQRLGQEEGRVCTDDGEVIEMLGEEVATVQGESENIKITNPSDMTRFTEKKTLSIPYVGMGYDVHRFGGSRPFILGGIPIPTDLTIHAHSDGDVLLHALMDALLGAAALGDIGQHFPDSDPAFANISSSVLLDHVLHLLREKNLVPIHADCTVIAQKPRLAPYREHIQKNIARLLNMAPDHINIKATTEEKLGFTGRMEGIKASCLVTCLSCAEERGC